MRKKHPFAQQILEDKQVKKLLDQEKLTSNDYMEASATTFDKSTHDRLLQQFEADQQRYKQFQSESKSNSRSPDAIIRNSSNTRNPNSATFQSRYSYDLDDYQEREQEIIK